jgi:hypothetical protein
MRTFSSALRALPIAAALWLATPLAWAQTQPAAAANDARIGTVKQVKGDTWIGPAEIRRPVQSGDAVQNADRLNTGPQGAASILLKDGTALILGPNSTVDLNNLQYNTTTQQGSFVMNLVQGSVRVVTGLLAKMNPGMFNIFTPTSVVGVRGTDFIVETEAAR